MTKTFRQLQIFDWLSNGRQLTKRELATQFEVSPRAIQRDISELNAFLADSSSHREITYNSHSHRYELVSDQHELTSQDVLIIVKVLLASRALNKLEMGNVINGLLHLIKESEQKVVTPIINNERFFYQPLHHQKKLVNLIWDFSRAIRHHTALTIIYARRDNQTVTRTILPEALIFSEYYFYAISYNTKYNANLLYRVDRILDYQVAKSQIKRERQNRIEDGQFRQRIQFMYPGQLITVQFQFWGIVEAALDRLPTGHVIKRFLADGSEESIINSSQLNQQPEIDGSVVIEADVYGERGIMMWLLSQGSAVKVLQPASLVTAIQQELTAMAQRYIS